MDTVTSVYRASTQQNKTDNADKTGRSLASETFAFPGRSSVRMPQFSNLVTLEPEEPPGYDMDNRQVPAESRVEYHQKQLENLDMIAGGGVVDKTMFAGVATAGETNASILPLNTTSGIYYVTTYDQIQNVN